MPFSNLAGNDLAKSALMRMAESKTVPNTLLFTGPDGVGKSLFALALAELLMGPQHAPKLASLNHPDLRIYRPEGKSSIHTMESMRALIDEVALPPFEAPVKVFILHDAHQMLPYSSNALLKTLEEPSLHSYFILLTSSPDAILPTIASRCRKVPFFPIPQPQIESVIRTKWQKTPEEARRIAFLSHGSFAKAQLLINQSQLPWRQHLLEILSLRMPIDYPQFIKLAAELEESCAPEEETEEESSSILAQADAVFEEITAWFRDLAILKEGISLEFLYHLDSMEALRLAASTPIPPMEKVLDQVAKARLALQRNVRLKTVLEHFFLNVS
jgi:DNA polymerase-3 subunit delta'